MNRRKFGIGLMAGVMAGWIGLRKSSAAPNLPEHAIITMDLRDGATPPPQGTVFEFGPWQWTVDGSYTLHEKEGPQWARLYLRRQV